MHELTVRWDHRPQDGDDLNAFGRNGMSRCAGIHAYDLGGRIILRPLSSKGFPARDTSIDLPADAAKLREIAAGLAAIAETITAEKRRKLGGIDTSEITEAGEEWFKRAKLVEPEAEPTHAILPDGSMSEWDERLRTVGATPVAAQLGSELTTPLPTRPEEGILRVLDMSTNHLSEASRLWLEDREYGDSRKLPVVAATDYGWLLWVPEQADETIDGMGLAAHGPNSDEPWPENVRRVLGFAQERSCAYLLLDADGPHWDGLWSENLETDETGGGLLAIAGEG